MSFVLYTPVRDFVAGDTATDQIPFYKRCEAQSRLQVAVFALLECLPSPLQLCHRRQCSRRWHRWWFLHLDDESDGCCAIMLFYCVQRYIILFSCVQRWTQEISIILIRRMLFETFAAMSCPYHFRVGSAGYSKVSVSSRPCWLLETDTVHHELTTLTS
eukprot:SAG31_NODE_10593_length_1120_cov_1.161606_3_plen_159_part_00